MTIVRVIRNRGAVAAGGGGGDAPDWVADLSLNVWSALPDTNRFSSPGVRPSDVGQWGTGGPDKVFEAWCGAQLVDWGTYKSIFHWGGGHADYYGNEVYCFDLETLTWSRLTNPSTAGVADGWDGPYTNGILSDGTPNVSHTYYFLSSRGSKFIIGRRAISDSPLSTNMISVFDPDALTWTNSTTSPSGVSPAQYDGMCYDPVRDVVWMIEMDALGWASWDPDSDTWMPHTEPTQAFNPGAGPVYVASKDCVINFVQNLTTIIGLDPGSPSTNKVFISTTGTGPASFERGDMPCWSANLGAVVYYTQGDTLFLLTPPSGNWRTETWTWSELSMSGTTGNHTGAPQAGTYGKFQIVEYGSTTVAIIVDDPDDVHYATRLT